MSAGTYYDNEWKRRSGIFREQIRLAAFAILAFGAMLALASLFADQLALGMPGTGFGWKQLTGTIIGLAIAGAAVYLLRRFPQIDDDADEHDAGGQNT